HISNRRCRMKHRSHLPLQEREARSKLIKLLRDKPFIGGGLVRMARTCGKAGCKCAKGDKHVSWYLATRHKGARKMICIPRQWEQDVIEWVNTYKEITKQVDLVSQQCLERFTTSAKEGRQRDS
ncbi:MAG TPA: DUF6788 family protein, partial [Candidatus Krumholzibacteriaceae bacterium]|nr:DUF6788 family protein [Candidatus Krumholzibacteriaceae bacterium]